MIRRTLFSLGLILIGAGLLIYGGVFHTLPLAGGPDGENPPAGDIYPKPAPAPAVLIVAEADIVKDVTIGGIIRTDAGALQRTYSGAPPDLCPT